MKTAKIKILNEYQKSEISALAEFVADTYCPEEGIIPHIIAKKKGISYCVGDYKDAFDGLIEHCRGNFHIYINAEHLYDSRPRFTFAHELGHYFLDHHRNALMNGNIPFHPSFTTYNSSNIVEKEADFFAACLLMPDSRFKQEFFRQRFSMNVLSRLSKKYQVSLIATALRFSEIGNHPIMVVSSSNNRINWYSYSKDFPYRRLLHGKQKIPENTYAFEYMNNNARYNEPEIVFSGDWFEVWDNNPNRRFFEHCYSYSYMNNKTVISIIWECN